MDTELREDQLTEPAQETAAEQTAEAERPASPETDVQEPPKEPKKKVEILIPLLTVLLILIGLGEAAFWGCFGFSSYRNSLTRERYEAQQKALEEERASKGLLGGSAYGPNLKVENGTVTWEREKEEWSYGGNVAAQTQVNRREDGLRLSWLSVFPIPYALAQMEAGDFPLASAPAVVDGSEVPTGT